MSMSRSGREKKPADIIFGGIGKILWTLRLQAKENKQKTKDQEKKKKKKTKDQ